MTGRERNRLFAAKTIIRIAEAEDLDTAETQQQ